jgi:hypothetical protein
MINQDIVNYIYYTDFNESDRYCKNAFYLTSVLKQNLDFKMDKYTPTYREILQNLGTEVLRQKVHPNIFVNAFFKAPLKKNTIITDLRFLNEAEAVRKRNGVIILVEKENSNVSDKHQSETELEQIPYDYKVSAKQGDLISLISQIKEIVQQL